MKSRVLFKNKFVPLIFLLPQVIFAVVFFLYPIWGSFVLSFQQTDPFGINQRFVWFKNYIDLFTSKDFLNALFVTTIISISIVFITIPISLLLALMVEKPIYNSKLFKTLLIWPFSIAPPVASVVWVFIFQPSIGIISRLLESIGYNWNYILNGGQALFLIIFVSSWSQIGYNFIFYLAALTSIPKSLIESAKIDGANSKRIFWHIIFPFISPTTLFLLIMNLIFSLFETFGIIDALTKGGPAKATETLIYKSYVDGITKFDLNNSATQSVILFFIGILLTYLQLRFFERRIYYHE
ncbi:MAG: ABC transporter permease subunit [Dictyoglomaceae bacterium]